LAAGASAAGAALSGDFEQAASRVIVAAVATAISLVFMILVLPVI
jgi:hypothetical protein